MNTIFLFLISILSFSLSAQTIKSDYASPSIIELCKKIGPSKEIIGLGESTHGTKEFTTVRAEVVKNLIQHYNFKIFMLEAEYIPCSKINNYILSGQGNPQLLLEDVLLWPWINKDFLDLIIWLKEYNSNHPLEPVSFYGIDSQLSKLYATKDTIQKHYPTIGKSLFEIIESSDKPKTKIKKLRKFSENIINQTSSIDLKLHYYILCRINRLANSKYKNVNTRDENMAYLSDLIYKKLGKKAMIWSHNNHIWKKKPSIFDRTPVGYYLSKKLDSKYVAIGLDFKEGDFNAVSFDTIDLNQRKVFRLKPIEETLSMGINHENERLIVIDCSTIKHKSYINSIGAIYINNPQKGDVFTSKIKNNKEFDYIISIPKSSPSEILIE